MASTVDSKRVQEFDEEGTDEFEDKIAKLVKMVQRSKYTVFYTGAGVSTSAGVGDYRGPTGAWTMRRVKELERNRNKTAEEIQELEKLQAEAKREIKKASVKVSMCDAQPTLTHMAQATLIRLQVAHYVVTTNLDGIYRKAGLEGHTQLCCLHGDVYIERCTACGYDFERNYHVRQDLTHVHDHKVGTCTKCGSKTPKHYTGNTQGREMEESKWHGYMIGTRDKNCGTKDTHINFGEYLDKVDWNEAQEHCSKADLCIVAGTSMSLRHITHFPFQAKKTVIINLQQTPDDKRCHLRIWAKCDPVFLALMEKLGIEIDPIPVWRPRDSVPIKSIPSWVDPYYVGRAKALEEIAQLREAEAEERRREIEGIPPSESTEESESFLGKITSGIISMFSGDSTTTTTNATTTTSAANATTTTASATPTSTTTGNDNIATTTASTTATATTTTTSTTAAGSPEKKIVTVNKKLIVGNTCKSNGENKRWMLFVTFADDKDAEKYIEKVEVQLHETFTPPLVILNSAPFSLTRVGWGTFTIKLLVHFKAPHEKPLTTSWYLSFDEGESSKEVDVEIQCYA